MTIKIITKQEEKMVVRDKYEKRLVDDLEQDVLVGQEEVVEMVDVPYFSIPQEDKVVQADIKIEELKNSIQEDQNEIDRRTASKAEKEAKLAEFEGELSKLSVINK